MALQFTDMMGRQVTVSHPPVRIVSVVPSQTELLYHLGLEDEVVGITKFCVHPEAWYRNKTRVGGTKKLHIDAILSLQPDIVIANKEENEKAQIDELAGQLPVWISDIQTVDDAFRMISDVANITSRAAQGQQLLEKIKKGFDRLHADTMQQRVAYFIWRDPWMTIGGDTFISDMLQRINWQNVYADSARYPAVTLEDVKQRAPQLILLSSEPYPFKEKHIAEIKAAIPNARVLLVDGEMFSWYGSRMLQATTYLQHLAENQ